MKSFDTDSLTVYFIFLLEEMFFYVVSHLYLQYLVTS